MKKNLKISAFVVLGVLFLAGYFWFGISQIKEKGAAKEIFQEEAGVIHPSSEDDPGVLEEAFLSAGEVVEDVKEKIFGAEESPSEKNSKYSWHKDISTTVFWIGEKAGEENRGIANKNSAWDDEWQERFGGTDNPKKRRGFFPADFVPRENPFYFALPYNDFNEEGKRKASAEKTIPWAKDRKYSPEESLCKNRWIEISKNGKKAYAQWEDVGPFREDDKNYVFGKGKPKNTINKQAGLDVSPAVRDYLEIKDLDKTDWRFVDFSEVPEGPWKEIITQSQVNWKK